MKRLNRAIKTRKENGSFSESKQDYINHFLERDLKNIVDFCALENLHNERPFSISGDYEFKDYAELGRDLSRQDNNNGFFICEITKDLKLKYTFISGFEDEKDKILKVKNPKQYLDLFYADKMKEISKKDKLFFQKLINGFLKFEGMNLFQVKQIKDQINKNKPRYAHN